MAFQQAVFRRPVSITVSPSLHYLHARFPNAAAWQISAVGKKDYETPEGLRVAPAVKFLGTLV